MGFLGKCRTSISLPKCRSEFHKMRARRRELTEVESTGPDLCLFSQGSSALGHPLLTTPSSVALAPPCNYACFSTRPSPLPAAPHLLPRISTTRLATSAPAPRSPPCGAACCLERTFSGTTDSARLPAGSVTNPRPTPSSSTVLGDSPPC